MLNSQLPINASSSFHRTELMKSFCLLATILFLALPFTSNAQYCASNATSTFDSKCDNVVLNGDSQNISNNTSGAGCQTYTNHTGLLPADLTQGGSYTVSGTRGTCGGNYTRYVNAWIDWNQDGDFLDANEMLGAGTAGSTTNSSVVSMNFTVPVTATLGTTRMRVIVKEGTATNSCGTYTYGETEDYTVLILADAPMTFVSSTSTTTTTADVENCATQAGIIGIQVVTTGSGSPIDLTQLRVQTNGSTSPVADLTGVSIYYTGTSSTFATSNLFGNAAPAAVATNIDFNGTQTLSAGTNYFWMVYDMNVAGTVGNFVDGTCSRITVDGSNEVPSNTNPAGNREIIDCARACPINGVILDEQFEVGPIVGWIPGTTYGSTWNGMVLSGALNGWFNLVNGLANVDVLDRHVDGLYVGCDVTVSYWARKSYGVTNVEFTMIDDNGVILAQNLQTDLSATYTLYTHTFAATTPGLRFVLHFNSTGASGIDVAMEDLLITQCCIVPVGLPVELTAFEANCDASSVDLNWTTISENNNDYFTIERSQDGLNFESMATIEGNGTSTETHDYSWNDDRPLFGTSYYRLSQTDIDGTREVFQSISVNCNNEIISISPNPFEDKLTITAQAEGSCVLMDLTGKIVLEQAINVGETIMQIDQLGSGTYIARIVLKDGTTKTSKLIKL